ncbi:MAG: NmrA family NAD(P)-binding protein [Acidimicrobiia bacterium]
MSNADTIAVFGATGAQGRGVVQALVNRGGFKVRALARNPERYEGPADEVVYVDLTKPETLAPALAGAYGVFANTNSFAAPDTDEVAQGTAAAQAAKAAGVQHYVWSTLPNVAEISDNEFVVPHFTNKARVNAAVENEGFRSHTFVEPPFYFQNLTSPMYQKIPGPDGTPSWTLPAAPAAGGMHMGDINEFGNLAVGAFESPERAGNGDYLSMAGDLLSWDDIIATLRHQGHDIGYVEATEDPYFLRDMFSYMAKYTYFGPEAEAKIAAADAVTTTPFTSLENWAATNMATTG